MKSERRVRRVSVLQLREYDALPVGGTQTGVAAWGLMNVIFACACWIMLSFPTTFVSPTLVSTAIPAPININRLQYDSALSRWNSLNIKVYEISYEHQLSNFGLTHYSLRVSDAGDTIEVLDIVPGNEQPNSMDMWTVESMFDVVGGALDIQSGNSEFVSFGYDLSYYIQFHPELGYPIQIKSSWHTYRGEVVGSVVVRITGFKILEQGTPTPASR